jgi:hypothetical protein
MTPSLRVAPALVGGPVPTAPDRAPDAADAASPARTRAGDAEECDTPMGVLVISAGWWALLISAAVAALLS